MGVLALAQPADAKIVYTPIHHVIQPNSSYKLDLNHDGRTDFTLSNIIRCRTICTYYSLLQKPADHNRVVGYTNEFLRLSRLCRQGARMAHARGFKTGIGFLAKIKYDPGNTSVLGPWPNTKSDYLGLKFDIKGKTHYGWARFNVSVIKRAITATLTGYAYETVPNKSIIAGRTKGPDAIGFDSDATVTMPTPEPAALGLLALGSPGVSIWRREESAVATQ